MPMNLAAMDLGSNSFHLLVARVAGDQSLTKLTSHKETLRLGSVVADEGYLPPATYRSALDAVGKMAAVARAYRAERLVAVGTSALRDARNGAEFCRLASKSYRLPVELLSGRDEGELVFRGARSAFADLPARVVVVDIGGGSVEVAAGENGACEFVASLPLGFLRLTRLGKTSSDELEEQVRVTSAETRAWLAEFKPDAWVFSGGTARAFGKLVISGSAGLGAANVRRSAAELARATPERLRDLGVDERRADILGFGSELLAALVAAFGIDVLRISPRGIREGVILRELERARSGRDPEEPARWAPTREPRGLRP